jgi:hypothetical protein
MESIKPLYSKGKTIHGAQSFERVPKDWVRYRKLRRTSRGGLFDFSTAARTKKRSPSLVTTNGLPLITTVLTTVGTTNRGLEIPASNYCRARKRTTHSVNRVSHKV